jgi:hypothetical protein
MTDEETVPDLFSCARCGVALRPGAGNFYRVTIEAVADPTFSAQEAGTDLRQEIERVLALLEGVSEREALDQVCRRLVLYLCGPCYRGWIEKPTG